MSDLVHSAVVTCGQGNLVKMLYVPKFLIYFRNTPVPVSEVTFVRLDSIITSFVWAGKIPRLARLTFQLPLSQGASCPPQL